MNICCNDVGAFLTASALLAAVSALWAQSWSRAREMYARRDKEITDFSSEFVIQLGLIWTNISILFALFAFATAVYNCWIDNSVNICSLAISFLIASSIMTILNVLQSLATALLRLVVGKASNYHLVIINGKNKKEIWCWIFLLIIALAGVMILSLSLANTLCCCYRWLGISLIGLVIILICCKMYKKIREEKKCIEKQKKNECNNDTDRPCEKQH